MKISFSTLGCPDWNWQDIYAMAKDIGFHGIELRGLGKNIPTYEAAPFLPNERDATRSLLKELRLEISCVTSSCCVKNAHWLQQTFSEGLHSIDLCAALQCKYVRILADSHPYETSPPDEDAAVAALIRLSDAAKKKNVSILVETNGVYANSEKMASLMLRCNRKNIGVLWDIHHPIRYHNEPPEITYTRLSLWIRHVHVKDSVIERGIVQYKMVGDGDIGVSDVMELLLRSGYNEYISLEWVKRWNRDIEDAAIVFPHYYYYMKRFTDPVDHCLISNEKISPTDVKQPFIKDQLIHTTLSELSAKMAAEYPDHEAFIFPVQNIRLSYKEFFRQVEAVSDAFSAIGIKRNDHVAMWATNCPEWVLTLFACARIGAVLITVNTSYKNHEIEYLLRQSDASTLVMSDGYKDADYVQIIQSICPEMNQTLPGELISAKLPLLRNIITISGTVPGAYHWPDILHKAGSHKKALSEISSERYDPHEVVNIQYTSGTTGFPKGVMLSHYNIVNNGKTIGDCMEFTPADRLLIAVPLFHCFGLVLGLLASFTHASTMVILDYYKPLKVMETIQAEKCTALHGVPTMFIGCLEHPEFDRFDFETLRTGIMAGSPCPIKVMRQVVEKMHIPEITIVYGQTEASPGCTQTRTNDPLEKRVSTVGKPLPGVECKIIDPETGLDVPHGKQGEFLTRGYHVMKGYYRMPEATGAAIDGNGWLHTGDLAVLDDDGYYKITGRMKDMIIRGGENIYPKEIEEYLYTHPAIADVQVVGVPDPVYGEEILASVILKDGIILEEDEIKRYVRENMARHKTPKYVHFTKSFPLTASGKIQKYRIREEAVGLFRLNQTDPS